MGNFKPIPIGVENFKRMIDDEYYFVDKTLMIKELIDHKSTVNLYTRPRRFGKTLNMSMLQYFFEKTDTDNSYLFKNLKIAQAGEVYQAYQGQFSVINLSLKSMKQPSFAYAFSEYKNLLKREFWRHKNVRNAEGIAPEDLQIFDAICDGTAEDSHYITAIRLLSDCLHIAYQKNVIILIDEYDVPLENAYFRGFYDEMVDLIRSAFESALKTNSALEFGILTGCLRISKESIFTGLNNLKVNTIDTPDYSDAFGFTEPEVKAITVAYGIENRFAEMKEWYDGYLFGKTEIYNPWSVLSFVSDAKSDSESLPKPYWSNTSSNDIIHKLVNEGDGETKSIIEELLNGGSVEKPIYEDITYRNVEINSDYIWSFLLFTGYLKQIDSRLEKTTIYSTMVIPNLEVESIYRRTVMHWFDEYSKQANVSQDLFDAVLGENVEQFEDIVNDLLAECISYFDQKENYYHGFLLGLLAGRKGYKVKSNRESGNGRPDILICEYQRHKLAIIIEIKVAEKFRDLEKKCDEALVQIEAKNYETELVEDCYQKIVKYGVVFYEKTCRVKIR